jgi:hypothetical protein
MVVRVKEDPIDFWFVLSETLLIAYRGHEPGFAGAGAVGGVFFSPQL